MAEIEYVVDGKVQAGIFPEFCSYISLLKNIGETTEDELKRIQKNFENGKGVKNPCWNCGCKVSYNIGGIFICGGRMNYKEKEFLIQPKVQNHVLT